MTEDLQSQLNALIQDFEVFKRHDHGIAGGEHLRTDLIDINDSDITFGDITTGNVTSTNHGYAPKSPADADKFLNGAATPDYTNVSSTFLTNTLATDHTAKGLIVSKTAGENLVFGDVVYFKSDGKVYKSDANDLPTIPAVGLAIATIDANTAGNILLRGIARDDTWNWTVGGVLYLSITAGALTQTQPTATDDAIQVLGVAHPDADTILFSPSIDYIQHT